MKKVTFYNSTQGGAFWDRQLSAIAANGYAVQHDWVLPGGGYRGRDSFLGRLRKVWLMYPWYGIKSFCGKQADIHVVTTNPFFTPALVCVRQSRRSPVVQLLYDLFPDALELSGGIRKGGAISKILAMWTRYSLRRCASTVFLGEHLQRHVETRYGKVNHPVIIPVGADGSAFVDYAPSFADLSGNIRVLYCGNMGRAHDIDTLLRFFAAHAEAKNVDWHFQAMGVGFRYFYDAFDKQRMRVTLKLDGYLADDQWGKAMKAAHVALITMKPGWEHVVMPSKAYSALMAGQAILAICPIESDLADLVQKHDCGWIVEPGDVAGLARIVNEISTNRELLHHKRLNAFNAGHRFYDSQVVAHQWIELFEELSKAK